MDSISTEFDKLARNNQFQSIPIEDKVNILAQLITINQARAAVIDHGLDILANTSGPDDIDFGLLKLNLVKNIPQRDQARHLDDRFREEYDRYHNHSQHLANMARQELNGLLNRQQG